MASIGKDRQGSAPSATDTGEPTAADATRGAIAHHTRSLRAAHGLSVRGLAEAAGISPALVSQVENAQANPTVEVLAALADALGTTLAELARVPSTAPVVMPAPQKGGQDDLEGRTLLPSAAGRRTEMYEMFLAANTSQQSAPHGVGSEEVAYVVSGSVEVSSDDWRVRLRAGDAVRFGAETEHAYQAGGRGARLVTAVSMPTV